MPKISFILPIYKVEKYLPRAINSLKNQTNNDWEAILIDDGSPDNCGKICDEMTNQDNRFKVIHQKNSGVGKARNAGLDMACGDYIHFFDPDDYIETDMVEKLSKIIDREDADIIIFSFYEDVFDSNNKKISSVIRKSPVIGVYKDEPFKKNFDKIANSYLLSHKLFRRTLIENKKIRFTDRKIGEDGVFFTQVYSQSPKCLVGLEDALYHYSESRDGSASNSYHPERVNDNFYLSDAIANVVKEWGVADDLFFKNTVYFCKVLDLQLSIKNISLSDKNFNERVRWLKDLLKDKELKKAINLVSISKFSSRNDKIKILLLKLHFYKTVILLSGLNQR